MDNLSVLNQEVYLKIAEKQHGKVLYTKGLKLLSSAAGMAMNSYYIILLELQVFHQAQEDQHCQADPAK